MRGELALAIPRRSRSHRPDEWMNVTMRDLPFLSPPRAQPGCWSRETGLKVSMARAWQRPPQTHLSTAFPCMSCMVLARV